MAVDPRKHQKKLEKQKAKQKAKRRELARRESRGVPARLEAAATAPILHCCTTRDLWKNGIASVLMSRELHDGNVAFVVFLVDMYCLGVKDVFHGITPRRLYERNVYGRILRPGRVVTLKPECARKLIEGAVSYAADSGLSPHADYRAGRLIFGTISAEACAEQFTYGKDGKPMFVSGPNDDAAGAGKSSVPWKQAGVGADITTSCTSTLKCCSALTDRAATRLSTRWRSRRGGWRRQAGGTRKGGLAACGFAVFSGRPHCEAASG